MHRQGQCHGLSPEILSAHAVTMVDRDADARAVFVNRVGARRRFGNVAYKTRGEKREIGHTLSMLPPPPPDTRPFDVIA